MTREEQDKLWNELSEENKTHYREQYSEQKTMSESGVPQLLEELFGKHNLQPALTYEDIVRSLKKITVGFVDERQEYFTSIKQSKKEYAIHKLLNVVKFLNKNEDGSDWVPDWKDQNVEKWSIGIDGENNIRIEYSTTINGRIVYFRTKELAKQVIQILGKDVIKTALGNY